VTFTATFSESVNGVDTTDFAIPPTGLSGASITSVTGSGSTRSIVVNTGTGAGSLGLNLVDDNSVVDAATNPLGGAGGIANGDFTGETYTVDKAVPTVTSIDRTTPAAATTNASSVTYTATFSESVSNVDTVDFSLSPTVTGASITSVTGSGSTRSVVVNTGTGSGSLGLNLVDDDSIVDGAGNKLGGTGINNGNFTGQTYTIDKVAPSVLSSNRTTPATAATNAASVTFTVTGVDSTDLSLATTGVSGAFITSVSADTGSTRTVVVNTGSGSGTIRLDIGDNDSIIDGIGNPLGGPGNANGHFITGEVYTIDKTAPTPSSITFTNGGTSTANRIDKGDSIAVVYSEELLPQSMCAGTPNGWSTSSVDQSLTGNNDVTVTLTNGVSPANDTITVSVVAAGCSTTFRFGSIDLGSSSFLTTPGSSTSFAGSGTGNRSTISWTAGTKTLLITLGSGTQSASVAGSLTSVYTPNIGITDFGTNGITGTVSTTTRL
jgi:hypothetical protein